MRRTVLSAVVASVALAVYALTLAGAFVSVAIVATVVATYPALSRNP